MHIDRSHAGVLARPVALLLFTTLLSSAKAQQLWPVDILHQRIELNLALGSNIEGHCTITAAPRADGTTSFPLQLLALSVDSVTSPLGDLAFVHTGEDLSITLAAPANITDTVELTVHYSGDPGTDPGGFGGFYTTGQYSYNLGVALNDTPHSYGRTWFPCADNFTERSSYEFLITTPASWNAWCNGELLLDTLPSPTTRMRHWRMDQTIPSYLASVAASNYAVVRDTFPSIAGTDIPVTYVARPPDTTNMKNSLVNMGQAFDCYEDWFGAYRWNKVGYVVTPLGSMEHSTSIHLAAAVADGSLNYQDNAAHELAHQWFGDLVTCDRAEEMYINEGFAEYLSYLFLEWVYGPENYMARVRANHKKMVHQAHLLDQGWWALDSIPQGWTYGTHSYNKGADVLHTLRSYLGDDLFRTGLTSFLDTYAFQPVNSEMLRDHLTLVTGVDLTDYFSDWIEQPGWADFEVDSMSVNPIPLPGGYYPTEVWVQQKQRGPSQPYHNVPVTLSFMDALGNVWTHPMPVMIGGVNSIVSSAPPFIAKWAILNGDDRISLATTGSTDMVTSGGFHAFGLANVDVTFPTLSGNVQARVEQHWVAADNDEVNEPFAYIISPDRYWRVMGNIPTGTTARIFYDGRNVTAGNIDPLLVRDTLGFDFIEDSLVMLYRAQPWDPWIEAYYSVNTLGSPTDAYGRITIDSLWTGEYTLAWRKSAVGIQETPSTTMPWTITPNPASDQVVVTSASHALGRMELIDGSGRMIADQPLANATVRFDLHGMMAGVYAIRFVPADGGQVQHAGSLVVQ